MEKKIIIVDDEKEIADLVELYLRSEGFETAKFYTALPALEYALREEAALAVLDVMLPDMDGFYPLPAYPGAVLLSHYHAYSQGGRYG